MPSPYDRSPYRPPFTGRQEDDVIIRKAKIKEDEILVRWTVLSRPDADQTAELAIYDIEDNQVKRLGVSLTLVELSDLHAALGEIIAIKEEQA